MNRRLLTAIGAAALMVATVMPMGVTAARPRLENQAKRFERVDIGKIDKNVLSKSSCRAAMSTSSSSSRARPRGAPSRERQQEDPRRRLRATRTTSPAPSGSSAARSRRSSSSPTTGSRCARAARSLRSPAARRRRPCTRPDLHLDNAGACRSSARPPSGRTSGTPAGSDDRGHRYRHRLHARELRGSGHRGDYAANDSTVDRARHLPDAPRSIDGWDFVGDAYDPENADGARATPVPDPDPLDCNGHGSHVAGTAAGFGVKADTPRTRARTTPRPTPTPFGIGPGVAPRAKLISLKVFGCDGGTSLVIDALDWVGGYNATHGDAIDVVNMSLGGIGGDNTPDSQAVDALVAAGVSVVASAGNEGPNAFMTGSPGNATGARGRRHDIIQSFPGANIDRAVGTDINGINQDDFPGLPVDGTLQVITDDGATADHDEHLGCVAGDYGALPPSSIAIIQRGECTFVEKGAAAQAAGAVGVIVINRDDIADPTSRRRTSASTRRVRHRDGRCRQRRQGDADRVGRGRRDPEGRAGDQQRELPPQRRLLVGRPAPGRQRAEAGCERARREHRVHRRRPGLQGRRPCRARRWLHRTSPASPPSSARSIRRGRPRRSRRSSSGRP